MTDEERESKQGSITGLIPLIIPLDMLPGGVPDGSLLN